MSELILQQLIFPRSDECTSKFFSGDFRYYTDSTIRLNNSQCVSTDSLINGFYETGWLEYSNIKNITCSIHYSGSGKIRVMREFADGTEELIRDYILNQDLNNIDILFSIAPRGSESRVYLECKTEINQSLDINNIVFRTDIQPAHNQKLTISICSYNKLKSLQSILNELLKIDEQFIEKIIVVNQGDDDMSELISNTPIKVIEQQNMGGSGGHARGMLESLSHKHSLSSFHLLLDDDVRIRHEQIINTLLFMSYAHEPICIGSPTINEPTQQIQEFGASLNNDLSVMAHHGGMDINSKQTLQQLSRNNETPDYVGWWCAFYHKDIIRQIELPLPFFIRGDDQEYGLRLKAASINCICLPILSIKHAAYCQKHQGWRTYYNFRNKLFLNRLMTGNDNCINSEIWKILLELLTHKYNESSFKIRALRDFLKGERLLKQNAEKIHQEILYLASKTPVSFINNHANFEHYSNNKKKTEIWKLNKMYVALYSLIAIFLPNFKPKQLIIENTFRHPFFIKGNKYILVDEINAPTVQLFERNRTLLFYLFIKLFKLSILYNLGLYKKVNRKNLSYLSSFTFWQQHFKKQVNN